MKGLTYFCHNCKTELYCGTLEIKALPGGGFGQFCKKCGKLVQVNF